MSTAIHLRYSFEEYRRFEAGAREKHEFVDGLILAMAGGTLEHGAVTASIVAILSESLRGKRCRVYDSNARVRVQATGNAFYPDVSVVCDRLENDPADDLSMTNPVVLVEVLSPSTAEYDRTDKLAEYQQIPSLQHVVHVANDSQSLDVWSRHPGGWSVETFGAGTRARLAAIGVDLSVSDIYRDPLSET